MKYMLLIAALALTALSACTRRSRYSCICTGRDTTTVNKDFSFDTYSKDEVYTKCKLLQDSTGDTCGVLIFH